jgi:hypothetical protein
VWKRKIMEVVRVLLLELERRGGEEREIMREDD